MLTLETLCEIINKQFGEPFLIRDGVMAEIVTEADETLLSICIGRRDIQINAAGEVVGSGTLVGMSNDTLLTPEVE